MNTIFPVLASLGPPRLAHAIREKPGAIQEPPAAGADGFLKGRPSRRAFDGKIARRF